MITAPGGLPLAGHALDLLRRPLEFLTELRELGDVVKFRIGPLQTYLLTSPDAVREVQITQRTAFGKGGAVMDRSRVVVGNGLATADGEEHRKHRKMMQPAFHHTRIAGYTEVMAARAVERAASWLPRTEISLSDEMHAVSADMLSRTLITSGADVSAVLSTAVPELVGGLGRRILLPFDWAHRVPLPVNRRYDAAKAQLGDLVRRTIAEYRADPGDRGDLMSMLLAARDEQGAPMSDEELYDEIITIMIGGVATTAETIVWIFHVLASHPDVEKRLQAEVDEVLAGRTVTYADLPRLEYLKRVIAEALRRYPPAWMVSRRTTREVEVAGELIPAGSDVFFSPHVLHHDPRSFPRPYEFDPDRWLPERAGESPRHAYIPFSTGFRKCIGDAFGQTEIMTVLAAVTARWQLRQVGEPVARCDLTYRLKECVMRVEPR
ncbi:cytochrome P450 [Lentzea sp. NPDC005914]|uniref:cytochrome P450 n=1 Tax=Lentzea sp. NPDC005914 TaxID=3154572 RepID=UPI0033D8E670